MTRHILEDKYHSIYTLPRVREERKRATEETHCSPTGSLSLSLYPRHYFSTCCCTVTCCCCCCTITCRCCCDWEGCWALWCLVQALHYLIADTPANDRRQRNRPASKRSLVLLLSPHKGREEEIKGLPLHEAFKIPATEVLFRTCSRSRRVNVAPGRWLSGGRWRMKRWVLAEGPISTPSPCSCASWLRVHVETVRELLNDSLTCAYMYIRVW